VELLNVVSGARLARVVRRLVVAFTACVPAFAPAAASAQAPAVEHAVKATFLYKFAPFIEWPPGTFGSTSEPLVICVIGSDGVTDLVDEAVKGQAIGGHVINVVHLPASALDARCHILYVALRGPGAARVLEHVRGLPVLTVTDGASGADAQGIVNFVVQDNRVRFEIDLRAAAENHLVISSKLLNLATRVSPKS
jgi:hypothetical protein